MILRLHCGDEISEMCTGFMQKCLGLPVLKRKRQNCHCHRGACVFPVFCARSERSTVQQGLSVVPRVRETAPFCAVKGKGKINGSVNEMIYFSFNEVYNKRKLWACVFSFIKMPDWTSVYLLGGVM